MNAKVAGRPVWIVAAALTWVVQGGLALSTHHNGMGILAIALTLLFALLLLWANRVAWVFIAIGAGVQLVRGLALDWDLLVAGLGLAALCCLVVPPSMRYMWTDRPQAGALRQTLRTNPVYLRLMALAYLGGADLASLESGEGLSQASSRSYRSLLWRLGIGCVSLFAAYAAAYNWQQGA